MEDFLKALKLVSLTDIHLALPTHSSGPTYPRSRRDEVGEEIIDMLMSFSDFLAFKQTILDYKAVRKIACY